MKTLIEDDCLQLIPYTHDDDKMIYKCFKDKVIQQGFNYVINYSFEQYQTFDIAFYPFWAVIVHKKSNRKIGYIRLSPFHTNPDLSIAIFKGFRQKGYGTRAYFLGLSYCFDTLKLPNIVAGCYEANQASLHMLGKLGFKRRPAYDLNERSVLTGKPIKQLAYEIDQATFASLACLRSY